MTSNDDRPADPENLALRAAMSQPMEYDEDGRFHEITGTDGTIIEMLISGSKRRNGRKTKVVPPLELVEIGLTFVDVASEPLPDAQRGRCLHNACRYIHQHGGTLMLGRFHNLDHGTNCCHAWVLTTDGRHVDPSGPVADGIYWGAPDPHGWVEAQS